ncbi:MAG: alpha/beta hydrolase [Bifidobacteriaceae bacterium]|jgi:pimeloyl-ACP methyl ester carboxylesterase|nr:alpha/beta hydrolase [Bifidobacteriaceae bacterium]
MTRLAVRGAGTLRGAAPPAPAEAVPLVLLHAYPLSSAMWGPLAAELPDLPILAVDLPGAGSSPTVEPVTIEAAAQAVAATLRELGVGRAIVGGCSMGGYVAMSLLRSAPELLAGLALMHTKAGADTAEARSQRLAVAREVADTGSVAALRPMARSLVSAASAAAQAGLVRRLERWIEESNPAGAAWAQRAMAARRDSSLVLAASGLPSLVVAGEVDPFATVAEAEAMADAIGPTAQLVVMADVAHLGPLEAPNPLSRLIREFYRRALG